MDIKPLCWDRHQIYRNFWVGLPDFVTVLSDLELDIDRPDTFQHVGSLGFVTWHGYRIPRVKDILAKIQALRPQDSCSAHIYISIFSKSETFGRHKDVSDVFYIQGVGKTSWGVEDNGVSYSYVLEEGDMLYIPKQMFHTPSPLTPRYGISIGFDTHTQRGEANEY
jgi:hypothetical protein